ncbi:MAG: PAS domain S-box protein, partial [Chloroflexales bacterium]|nr:PAS domain S-box protein [Chloroflexales bacterium]
MEAGRPGAAAVPNDPSAPDNLLRQIVAYAPEGIVVTTPTGRFHLVNPAAGELLGYDQLALIGCTWRELLLDREAPDPLQGADLPPGAVHRHTCRVRHHDGRVLTIELSSRRLADGHLLHMLHDLTTRAQEEARLRASEARYRSLAEAAEDSIFLIAPDETVQYVNPAGARFLDLTPEAIVGRRYAEFFTPENIAEQRAQVQQVFLTGTA